ncbi:MAG: nucleotide pyrophosphohydrolase [Clostridiales bacterium]|nr:nucleotide pyrophosphohydrolase [Clostridiales bacterium]
MSLSLRDVQEATDRYIREAGGYWSEKENILRLVEEVGELSREVSHLLGPKRKKPEEKEGSPSEELGDILFVVAVLANQLGVDLEAAFAATLEKYRRRDGGRWRGKGEGA